MQVRLGFLLMLLVLAGCGSQPVTQNGHSTLQDAAAACAGRPAPARDACIEAALAPTPEQAARMRDAQRLVAGYYTRTAEALAATGQPVDLALAASVIQMSTWQATAEGLVRAPRPLLAADKARKWGMTALASAGDDVLSLAMLAHGAVFNAPPDDAKQAAARWRALEPDNLAAWIADDAAPSEWLPRAKATTHYDSHSYRRLRWMIERLQKLPPNAQEAAALLNRDASAKPVDKHLAAALGGLGIWLAEPIPAVNTTLQACRGTELAATATRRADCRHVAMLLADASDTSLAHGIGIAMLRHLAQTEPERADVARRRQIADWQHYHRARLEPRDAEAGLRRFLALLADPSIRNENELAARILADAGIAAVPPPDWRPPPVQHWIR